MCENENSESLYIWKVGEVAVAWLSKKAYAKVTIVKDKRGRFHGDKVLGITVDKDGSSTATEELCYYVETYSTKQQLWIPWTSLRLAERSRPFYGPNKPTPKQKVLNKGPESGKVRKATLKVDTLLPFTVRPEHYKTPDFNAQYEQSHQPLSQRENSFREFVRRGKEVFFDTYFKDLLDNPTAQTRDTLEYLLHVDASTEDKFSRVMEPVMTEREVEEYLHQCWRYNTVHKRLPSAAKDDEGESGGSKIVSATPWCLVCGAASGRRRACPRCPAAYHVSCRRDWLLQIIHRKNPPLKPYAEPSVTKVLSSTRAVRRAAPAAPAAADLPCPSCMWGPKPGYDDVVWHKLGTCSWWPARVLAPGDVPACLLARQHTLRDYALRYYGTLNHAWGRSSQMALFLPAHAAAHAAHAARPPQHRLQLHQAVMDAADDYIRVYLT